jgi:hypothetical protein
VDQTNTYVFEVNTRGIGVSASRSLPYWSTGNGDDTMVTVWNPADEAQDFVFKMFFSGGQYGFPIHLGARATQTFNISQIIQNQVPDSNGNIVPAGIHEGSAEVMGSLADNQQILFAVNLGIYNVRKATCTGPNCISCNGIQTTAVTANPFGVPVGGQTQLTFKGTWNTGTQYNYTTSSNWSSNNTPVATVQTGLTNGVSSGSATITARLASAQPQYAQVCSSGVPICPTGQNSGNSGGTVFKFVVSDKAFIFVGTDSTIVSANSFFASDGAGGSPKPTGGNVSAMSSNSSDTFQITQGSSPQIKVTTQQQSSQNSDRTLTFTYTVSGASVTQAMNVTARKFFYLTNNSPSNQCTLGHGTKRTYQYTVYTHPDNAALDANSGPTGTPVSETFDQTPQCLSHTGDTILDDNAQFSDSLIYCGNVPLTCTETRTQTLKIAGVTVRTNNLKADSNGVTYTSNGPTQ